MTGRVVQSGPESPAGSPPQLNSSLSEIYSTHNNIQYVCIVIIASKS